MKTRLIAALIAAIATIASAESAEAQGAGTTRDRGGIRDTSPQARPQDLSVLLYIPWWHGVGVGVMGRYEIPIVPNGFIPAINDQFSLEPALGFEYNRQRGYYYYGNGDRDRANRFAITPALYAMWSFHITPKFRPYAAIGLGGTIALTDDDWIGSPHDFFFDSAVGLFLRFSDAAAFRAELGAGGPKVGFTFYL